MTTKFRCSFAYDFPEPGVMRIVGRVTGGTPEEDDQEAARVAAALLDERASLSAPGGCSAGVPVGIMGRTP